MKKRKYSRHLAQVGRRQHWNKKGQFFLIAALITIMILFTLTVKYNTIKQTVALEDFKEVSEGYAVEQPKVINLAIAQNEDEARRLQEFTKQYTDYARGKEPSFGILYAYRDSKGNIRIVNSLGNRVINIEFKDVNGNDAKIQLLSSGSTSVGTIGLNVGGQTFGTSVSTNVENYGSQLTATDLTNVQKLEIVIPGYRPIVLDRYLEEFKKTDSGALPAGQTYTLAEEERGGGTVKATLTGFAVSEDKSNTVFNLKKCKIWCIFLQKIKTFSSF